MVTAETFTAGVSFALTDEQRALRELAHEFAEKEIRPKAAEYDEEETHPADIFAQAHDLGLVHLHVPVAYGGPGLSVFDSLLVAEELNWGCSGIATSLGGSGHAAAPLLLAGTHEQKETWLRPLFDEPTLCSLCLSEPNAGSDVSGIETTAVRHGGEYVINGSKTFITNGGRASWFTVFASTDRSQGHRGLTALLVPADADGVVVEKKLHKMGQRATTTSSVAFQSVMVPAANRIGAEGDGFKIAMRTLDVTRPQVSASAVGVARAAYEHACAYAKERVQFGQPIATNQGVSFLIADMVTKIEAARLLAWQAAWMLDAGFGRRTTLYAAIAKRFAADTVMEVTTDAVQVMGGYGYMKEYPVEKLMRDAKLFQIYEGTSQIQRVVIARDVLSRPE